MLFVDLFCGTGGLSRGMLDAGHDLLAGFDKWRAAVAVYNANLTSGRAEAPGRELDLSREDEVIEAIRSLPRQPELMVGGPPCQEFSSVNKYRAEAEKADLTPAYARTVAAIGPRAFVMENVPNVAASRAFAAAVAAYRAAGYGLCGMVLDAAHCGMPQRRRRFILAGALGAEDGFLAAFVAARLNAEPITVRQHWAAQGIELGLDVYYRHPHNYGKKAIFGVDEPAPTVRGINRGMPANYPDKLAEIAEGKRAGADGKLSGKLPGNASPPFPGLPAMTHDQRGMLQGFPPRWNWLASGRGWKGTVEQMIGNAVPVGMARVVGQALADWASGAVAAPPPPGLPESVLARLRADLAAAGPEAGVDQELPLAA